jgi:ubiquinone/menaquinone biosynthesis C-methylase UbiE
MSYEGAWWLDRADRDSKQQPEHVLDVIGIHAGQTVADVGCGTGYFTVRIAKRVAPKGRVLAVDVQPQMLDLLRTRLSKEKIDDVVPILATETDVKLPAREVDVALMVDVYHELARPDLTMAQVKNALRPGTGKLVLVEYRAEDPKVEIKPEHKMTLPQIKTELAAAHFTFVSSDESLPEQRIVTFVPEADAGATP